MFFFHTEKQQTVLCILGHFDLLLDVTLFGSTLTLGLRTTMLRLFSLSLFQVLLVMLNRWDKRIYSDSISDGVG